MPLEYIRTRNEPRYLVRNKSKRTHQKKERNGRSSRLIVSFIYAIVRSLLSTRHGGYQNCDVESKSASNLRRSNLESLMLCNRLTNASVGSEGPTRPRGRACLSCDRSRKQEYSQSHAGRVVWITLESYQIRRLSLNAELL